MATIHPFPNSNPSVAPARPVGGGVAALYETLDAETLIRHRNLIDAALIRKGRPTKPYSALTGLDLLPPLLEARQKALNRYVHLEIGPTGIIAYADGVLPLYSTGTAADALCAIDNLLTTLPLGGPEVA